VISINSWFNWNWKKSIIFTVIEKLAWSITWLFYIWGTCDISICNSFAIPMWYIDHSKEIINLRPIIFWSVPAPCHNKNNRRIESKKEKEWSNLWTKVSFYSSWVAHRRLHVRKQFPLLLSSFSIFCTNFFSFLWMKKVSFLCGDKLLPLWGRRHISL
jgi:hypothetical protein